MSQEQFMEEKRLQFVKETIERKLFEIEASVRSIRKDENELRSEFRDDLKINLDNIWDKFETYASLQQQTNTLAIKEQTRQHIEKQYTVLKRLRQSPYFARVDFKEDGSNLADQIYIGISTLREHEDKLESFLIYDWRAPISSIYYDHIPGPAYYEFGDEKVSGEMLLKRQFVLKNGQFESMFDTSLAIVDEMLKDILGKQATNQMKNIVATIQKDQNQIIRNTRSNTLIIQGAAGSGKTSVALQRVAFLLYQSQYKLNSDNMLLFSPNPIFSSYVSTVLPELGEENIKQLTYQEFVEKRLGNQFKLESSFEQIEFILTEKDNPHYLNKKESIRLKANLPFKKMIDSYVERLSKEGLLFKNISFNDEVLISSEEIKNYFYSLSVKSSIQNRVHDTARWLLKELDIKEEMEREKDWVLEEIELLDSDTYIHSFKELEEEKAFTEDTFDDYEREQNLLITKLIQKRFKPIRNAIKALRFVHITSLYLQLFKEDKLFLENINEINLSTWREIGEFTTLKLKEKTLPYEDQAPYLYLIDKLIGNKVDKTIRHLFIDEAQDYSPIQYFVMKQLFPSSKMTILGDLNQAILAQSVGAPTMLTNELYDVEQFEKMILTKSYRSTKQIIDFTKEIIDAGEQIEAFDRMGPVPTMTIATDIDNLHKQIIKKLNELKQSFETIAVICKNGLESRLAYEVISNELEVQLVHSNSKAYRKGIVILPTYMAKGVEFDAVLIYNASKEVYNQELERNILYTSCTRAMHELHMFSMGEPSVFLKKNPENL